MIELAYAMCLAAACIAQEPDDSLQAIANSVKQRTAQSMHSIEASLPKLKEELRLKKRAIISGPRSKPNVSVGRDGNVDYYFYPTKEMKNEAIQQVETSLKKSEETLKKLSQGQAYHWPVLDLPLTMDAFGLLGTGQIVQVIDEKSALIKIVRTNPQTSETVEATIMLKDFDTENMTHGSTLELPGVFRVAETTEFDSAIRGRQSFYVLRPIDKAKVEALLKK